MHSSINRSSRAGLGLVAAFVLACTTAAGPAGAAPAGVSPVASASSAVVRATALPTVQIDGIVWAQTTMGNTVYAGGRFAAARPAGAAPGTDTVPRSDLLAYDITTGELDPSFAPTFNGEVEALALSPNHKVLYVGGAFTTVNGQPRAYLAAFDTATGALLDNFAPTMDNVVYAIAASVSKIYVGGDFSRASGASRARLAAFRPSDGHTLAWGPRANRTVKALLINPSGSHVIIGGKFNGRAGTMADGLGAVDAVTGASVGFAANQTVHAFGSSAGFTTLSTDGKAIYGGAFNYQGNGGFEGTFSADPNTGALNWVEDCHGDTYSVFSPGSALYAAAHPHFCANIGGFPEEGSQNPQRAVAFTRNATGTVKHNTSGTDGDFGGQPSPSLINWLPDFTPGDVSGDRQAAWSVTGTANYISMAGEFPTVNGVPQQGIVRFAVPALSPDTEGPRLSGSAWTPTASAVGPAAEQVSISGNWDRDDKLLSYSLSRDTGPGTPTSTITTQTSVSSLRWREPTFTGTDSGAFAGATYRYWVTATDAKGNSAQSGIVTVTR